MKISRPRATKISQLTIDADLAMGAHDITLGAEQTVDGIDLGVDAMLKSIYDSDLDGKIAKDQLNNVIHTISSEILYSYFSLLADNVTTTSYTALGKRGHLCVKGGDYKISGEYKTSNLSTYAFLGYRINGGGWVEIANSGNEAYHWSTSATLTLNDGDIVELGIKGYNSDNAVYIKDYRVYVLKINRIE